ncbi:UNVERIFIED_CONTAM: hypothetical protein Slati_4245600 [Sesamum latifolium]|uniref:Reverse transcriptase domain-containing protein n=1 Tax=Sesamum latifolium TaxID=2727402 RepID=A0AAW2TCY2_9LAMI
MEEPRPAAIAPSASSTPADGAPQGQQQTQTEAPVLSKTAARVAPNHKMSYAKTVQQPSTAHFQHDPLRAAKKIFQTKYLASRLKISLVGKFSHGLPNLNFLRYRIVKLGLKGTVNVGRLNFKHVLIRLNNEEDFSRLWLRGEWTFDNFHMRVFKWSPNFDPQTESPIAPVWIKLPGLPVHLFEKNVVFTFVAKIGKPLRMDEPTADLSRPDLARVCVEIDLTAPKVQTVHLQINGKTYRQQVVYENCPPYCTFCNHLGHDMSACISKHHPGINHTDKEPRPTGNTSSTNEGTRDLREIINYKRKGKAVATNDTHLTSHVVSNIVKNGAEAITPSYNVNDHNVNDAANGVLLLPHLHVPITVPFVEPSRPGHVEMASPDDFNYEDPLIAELLTKIGMPKTRDKMHLISLTLKQRKKCTRKQSRYMSLDGAKLTLRRDPIEGESEGEEELTPVSNRFQSLEDMESDDILQLIESTEKSTSLAKNSEAGGSKAETQDHRSGENTHQEMILTDSTASHRHKRNKSLEEDMSKASKTGGKGERSPGPIKEFGEDLTESFILRSGLKHLTSLELCTYLEDCQTTILSALKRLKQKKKPSSFRFQNMWLHHQSFLQTVKQSWELPIEGYGMYKLQQKIYRTKELLKKWNRETFGNVFTTVQQAKQEATDAEKKFDRDPSEANLIALNKSNAVMVHALTLEAEYWKQKSNCKWLEAGERNTKYFHSLVKKKRFPKIPEAIGNNLCLIPTEEDIKETVFSIDKKSVAGPDRFSSAFYQACWEFIARDIYDAVRGFFSGTPMPRSFTATTIVLIPKVDSPQTWNDFRPISLCNVTNKILSKLLYRRISQALSELISPSQSAFVPDRLISDNILIAQEMIHHLDLRYKNSNLVIKLDMSKAYDRVSWAFLLIVMQKMGFPTRFLTLIKHAIKNCWFTVLVNGEAAGFFKSTQGLRQGTPSPQLFSF